MTTLRPYPKYKSSGIDWLGDIPSHWTIRKAGHCFALIGSGTTPQSGNMSYHNDGSIPWINTGDLNDSTLTEPSKKVTLAAATDYPALRLFPCGSLIVAMYGATIGKTGVTNFDTTVNQACCVLAQPTILSIRFAQLAFIGLKQSLVNLAVGGGQPNISQEIVRQFRLPIPPLNEQHAIAAFLHALDERVTRFTDARRRMIALLEEQKQGIFAQAVTKGLDPDVAMKPSGNDWLGDIPAHWDVTNLGRMGTLSGGMTPSKDNREYWSGHIPWISPKDMKLPRISRAVDHISDHAVRETGLALVPVNSILIVVRGMILARHVPVAVTEVPLTINQDVKALSPRTGINASFLAKLLESAQDAIFPLIDEAGHGTRRLPTPSLMGLSLAIPPEDEQRRIVAYIDSACLTIDRTRQRYQREIDLIQEYRTRLIADVVTGRLDVRVAAADDLPTLAPSDQDGLLVVESMSSVEVADVESVK